MNHKFNLVTTKLSSDMLKFIWYDSNYKKKTGSCTLSYKTEVKRN